MMKNKNLSLIAVLSAGFLIQGISTAYADDSMTLKSESSLIPSETGPEIKTRYTTEDTSSLENEIDALIKEFNEVEAQIKNVEENGVTKPSAEEKAAAQAQWDKGSIGFFETNGSYEAIDVFRSIPSKNGVNYNPSTGPEYLYINHIGSKIDKGDSRSLENMKYGIESLRVVNAKRQLDGGIDGRSLSTIGISDFDMAVAQANANYSSVNRGHSSIYGPPYENLFWAGPQFTAEQAIEGWWNEEKLVFDYLRSMGLQSRNEMEDYINRNRAEMKNKFRNPQVGHYLNLVDDLGWGRTWSRIEDTISAGYARNLNEIGYGSSTISIVMNPSTPTNRTVYSIDDYEAKFLAYYNKLDNIVNKNIKAVDKGSLEEINLLKNKSSKIEKELKEKKDILAKLKKEKAKLNQDNEKYIRLKKSVEDNKIVVKAAQLLLDFSPQKVARVKPQLLRLMADSEAKVKKAEAILAKNGML